MSFSKLFYLVPFVVFSFIFSNCPNGEDVCLSLDGANLNYDSGTDIAGFQFGHDGCAVGASGGDAGAGREDHPDHGHAGDDWRAHGDLREDEGDEERGL